MKTLQEFHQFAKTNYEFLQKQALAKVVRWKYGTGRLYTFQPLRFELDGAKRGREITSPEKARFKYGFDANDQLVYALEFAYEDSFHEDFLCWDGANTFVTRYGAHLFPNIRPGFIYSLQGTRQMMLDADGKLSRFIYADSEEQYTWRDNKVIRIDFRWPRNRSGYWEPVYDEAGEVEKIWEKIWEVDGPDRTLRYKRLEKGINVKSLEKTIHDRLVADVRKTVANAKIKEPVYCLALAYDGEGNDVLGPYLGIGLESERQTWFEQDRKTAKLKIWNPAEFTHYEKSHTQLMDTELGKACAIYNQLMNTRENKSPAVKLLVSVAIELGKIEWKDCLETTNDFVIYAVDFELGDLNRNLQKSVSIENLAKLKKSGYF